MNLVQNPQPSLRYLGSLIHRKKTRLWHLNKALAGIPKYYLAYCNMDIPYEYAKTKQDINELEKQRDHIKETTPKNLWYPNKRRCGHGLKRKDRWNANRVIDRICEEAVLEGFNVKTIAAYFELQPVTVYQRIDMKALKVKMMEKELLNRCNNS